MQGRGSREVKIRRRESKGLIHTLCVLYGQDQLEAAPALETHAWPADPKLRCTKFNEGLRKNGFKVPFLLYDSDAPLENDPEKIFIAIRWFLLYCKISRFTIRMALRRFFRSLRCVLAKYKARLEKRKLMFDDMVDRWRALQKAAVEKLDNEMKKPTYHIHHNVLETLRTRVSYTLSDEEMLKNVISMYHVQRSKYQAMYAAWCDRFNPVCNALIQAKATLKRQTPQYIETVYNLRQQYMEIVVEKPSSSSMDKKISLVALLRFRAENEKRSDVLKQAAMLEKLQARFRAEAEALKALNDKAEAIRIKEYSMRRASIEKKHADELTQMAAARTVVVANVSEVSPSAERRSSLERKPSDLFSRRNSFSMKGSSELSTNFSSDFTKSGLHSPMTRRRSSCAAKTVTFPKSAQVVTDPTPPPFPLLTSAEEAQAERDRVVQMLAHRRDLTSTPAVGTFLADLADEPRVHCPLSATLYIKSGPYSNQPVSKGRQRPADASRYQSDVERSSNMRILAQMGPQVIQCRPSTALGKRLHELRVAANAEEVRQRPSTGGTRREAALPPSAACVAPFTTVPVTPDTVVTLDSIAMYGRMPGGDTIVITPPICNSVHSFNHVTRCGLELAVDSKKSGNVLDDPYVDMYNAIDRPTVLEMARIRDAKIRKLESAKQRSVVNSHASFASSATRQRASSAMSQFLNFTV